MDTEGLIRLCEAIFQTATARKFRSKTPTVFLGSGIATWRKVERTENVTPVKRKWTSNFKRQPPTHR